MAKEKQQHVSPISFDNCITFVGNSGCDFDQLKTVGLKITF
jgi:hypothetical protein